MRVGAACIFLLLCGSAVADGGSRLVILKVDGLNEDLLERTLAQRDPATGKSQLPWLSRIFVEHGTVYENFYTRGISLSAPSWSMLDTGRPGIIRGNVEYDRYTGEVYDYLNFFPLYVGYAQKKQVDMPGVEVLERAGIPLVIDHYQYPQVYQSFQLFQRGVRWTTLQQTLLRKFSSKAIFSMLEGATPSYDSLLQSQTQAELEAALNKPTVLYLDLFVGRVDHEGHATSDPAALLHELRQVDTMAGQIWTAIQAAPLADNTVMIMVSDHGMNNTPGIVSQTFSLPDLLNSPAGGSHHVITDREQLSDFKLKGLNPNTHRVTNASPTSSYLAGKAGQYPTAWLDIDGNERAAVQLRNSDLNKIQILLEQLEQPQLPDDLRKAAGISLGETLDKHRGEWSTIIKDLSEELQALQELIVSRKPKLEKQPLRWGHQRVVSGERTEAWRRRNELDNWEKEWDDYTAYLSHLKRLVAFEPDLRTPLKVKISDLVAEKSLGDRNSAEQLRHYVTGPAAEGLQLAADGRLDEERSFRYVDYPKLFSEQRARNRPQKELAEKPIDFTALRLGDGAYLLYGDEDSQLEISTDEAGRILAKPVKGEWRSGLPLELFEDSHLQIPAGRGRAEWLSEWHTEKEWMAAVHLTRYSNGVIGIVEDLAPIEGRVPGQPGISQTLLRYERRRRQLVQTDLEVFAADHWNFNVRFPNPGGNHGSYLRISTHSVWMMSGTGIATQRIAQPVDSLQFAPTVLALAGK